MELDPNGDLAAPEGDELDRRVLVPLGTDAAAVLCGMPVGLEVLHRTRTFQSSGLEGRTYYPRTRLPMQNPRLYGLVTPPNGRDDIICSFVCAMHASLQPPSRVLVSVQRMNSSIGRFISPAV